MNVRYLSLCGVLTFAVACGGATDDGKGAEEQPLTDGKSDSFFSPTEHGPMRFEVGNPGTIEEDAWFHAWNFELGDGGATVELRTEISRNLDTVMYLYHRTDPEDSWGRYIEKNDDHGDEIWSQIREELEPGEYRVIVKPFKKALTGDFSLYGKCEGDGCPTAGTDECSVDSVQSLPTYTQWTSTCMEQVVAVLASEKEFTTSGEVTDARRCDLAGIELLAVDHYISWFDDIVGFEESFDWADYDGEGIPLDFTIDAHDQGTVAHVDGPGDEAGMTLIYDNDSNLLAIYQHNQSPTLDVFCPDDGSAPVEGPGEGCFSDVMYNLPHGDEVGGDSGTTTLEQSEENHGGLAAAAQRFVEAEGLEATDELEFQLLDWEDAVEVTLSAGETSMTYHVVNDWQGWVVRVEAGEDGTAFVCD